MPSKPGVSVYLVGAGPGDPGLLTRRACQVLSRADVVLYDYLVNPVLPSLATNKAQLICLGKHGRSRIWSQEEINEEIVKRARDGQCVVRLKGGDPNIFGRLVEEASYLEQHGVPYEVVPGVSAATAVGAYAGVPLTSSGSASAVAFITGQELREKQRSSLDFAALARFPGTIVVYMGVTTADRWVAQLIEHGKRPETPVSLVRRISFPDQQITRCPLAEVPDRLTPYSKFPPPVIAIVGDTADTGGMSAWFTARPLFGQTVLVTRPLHQQAEISASLGELGADVYFQPAIEIRPLSDPGPLSAAVEAVPEYDWLVFSSVNGVKYFFQQMTEQGWDTRHIGSCRVAAIGAQTASDLVGRGIKADIVPADFCAEALAAALLPKIQGQSVLVVRANRGREFLVPQLQQAASHVSQVAAYESVDVAAANPAIRAALEAGSLAWTTVTSSAIARSLIAMFGDALRNTKLVSISPVTSSTLRDLGFTPSQEAITYSCEGVVQAICAAVK